MTPEGDDLIEVKFDFREFGAGKTLNQSLSLLRPFRLLIDEGKPIGRINHVFYFWTKSRVLGALWYTPWRRLLFFPGLVGRIPRWYSKDTSVKHPQIAPGTVIDHLTLEADFKSFHVTLLGPSSTRSVLMSRRTQQVVDGLTYWFGVSMQSEEILEECPGEFECHFSSPPTLSFRWS